MKKFGKIFLSLLLILVISFSIITMMGCDFNDDTNTETNKIELTNGNYIVSIYSIDGVNQNEYVGKYCTFNNEVFVDWLNNVGTYFIEDKDITLTWQGDHPMVLTGVVSKTSIRLSSEVNEKRYIIVLDYVEDTTLNNGNYVVSIYSIDGVSQNEYIGKYCTISNGIFSDWFNDVATYTIKGNSLTIVWNDKNIYGVISNQSINIDYKEEGHRYILVLNYEA